MRAIVRLLAIFAWVVLVPSAALAQAVIAGSVKDSSGAVLPGVNVEVASPALIEKVRAAVSDGSGSVPHRGSAARHVYGDVHAAGVQHVQA